MDRSPTYSNLHIFSPRHYSHPPFTHISTPAAREHEYNTMWQLENTHTPNTPSLVCPHMQTHTRKFYMHTHTHIPDFKNNPQSPAYACTYAHTRIAGICPEINIHMYTHCTHSCTHVQIASRARRLAPAHMHAREHPPFIFTQGAIILNGHPQCFSLAHEFKCFRKLDQIRFFVWVI